jgi:hypothetical protein
LRHFVVAPNNGPTFQQKNQKCLNTINNTPDGKLYNFLSPLSMIPGVGNPDPAESAFEYGAMGSAKFGAFKFFQAAGQNWSGTGLGTFGKAVSGLTEDAVAAFAVPVMAAASTGWVTVHAGCAISAAF